MTPEMTWRPEDEALLLRLEDEALGERLHRFHVGNARAAKPPPRASGLLAELRKLPRADEVFAEKEVSLEKLGHAMAPDSYVGYPPALLHHLAIHFYRVAGQLELERPSGAVEAYRLSLAAFFALAQEGAYLGALADAVLGADARKPELSRASQDLAFDLLERLGQQASEGARKLSGEASVALAALGGVERALDCAGAKDAVRQRARSVAERARANAIDEALAPIGEALDDANSANELTTRGIEALRPVPQVWEWCQRDEAVERFFVERAEPVCWELQRRREWDRFSLVLGDSWKLVESLTARVERDRGRIAYAAACAQFFVFYTNVVHTLERQIALCRRAIAACPSHRNGRAVLASFLCQKARRMLDGMQLLTQASSIREAELLVAEARALFPALRELEETEALLQAKRGLRLLG